MTFTPDLIPVSSIAELIQRRNEGRTKPAVTPVPEPPATEAPKPTVKRVTRTRKTTPAA